MYCRMYCILAVSVIDNIENGVRTRTWPTNSTGIYC